MRVLLVEDEPQLAATLERGLRREGIAVDTAADGATALEKATLVDYDVVVLDRALPIVHGDVVCASLRERETPSRILMLTASGTTRGPRRRPRARRRRLPREAVRVRRARRADPRTRRAVRPRRAECSSAPAFGSTSDVDEVTRDGDEIKLTPKELAVLEELLAADGNVVSAEELLERAWDEYTDPFTNTVRVTVMTLRRKLGDPPVIETVTGAGYQIP